MSLAKNFVPQKPFPNFKWKWASLQCTEGINDPVVLLGVLFRMRELEKKSQQTKYSSANFANEMESLAHDLKDSNVGIDLSRRTGERNLMRNSAQYWKALGLIPKDSKGYVRLTPFGKQVAEREISQSEFAAITIVKFALPNPNIQDESECALWQQHKLLLHPLALLLSILRELGRSNSTDAFLTRRELIKIIIPLSGHPETQIADYANFLRWNRRGEIDTSHWPNCTPAANDSRIAREFLLFLTNYGYLTTSGEGESEHFSYNTLIDDEIAEILAMPHEDSRIADIAIDIERKRVQATRNRPNQAKFRKDILEKFERCVVTNVTMPEVLEAAHIKPFKYRGADTVDNGFCLRMDIHQLFDAGHLRINTDGAVHLSNRARLDYGASIPPRIVLPDFTSRECIHWRWTNYNGL